MGGKSEDGIKAEIKALRGQFIGLMSLFAVTEAVALVLAALALKKQALAIRAPTIRSLPLLRSHPAA